VADGVDPGHRGIGHPRLGQVADHEVGGRVEVVRHARVGGQAVQHPHFGSPGQQLVDHV
jgi:hypothetical protein